MKFVIHFDIDSQETIERLDEYVHSLDAQATILNDSSRYFEADSQVPDIFEYIVKEVGIKGPDSFYVHEVTRGQGIGAGAVEYKNRLLEAAKAGN
jgi:GNAT superfamily N-acetyltransferase